MGRWDRNFYMEQQRLQKLQEEKELAEAGTALSLEEDAEHNTSGFA